MYLGYMELIFQTPFRQIFKFALMIFVLIVIGNLSIRPSYGKNGLNKIIAGPWYWTSLILSVAISSFLSAMIIHSGAPPFYGEDIFFYIVFILPIFSSFYCIVKIIRIKIQNIEWCEDLISFTDRNGRHTQDMRKIVTVYEKNSNIIVIKFENGLSIKIDKYYRGALQLVEVALDTIELNETSKN